MEKATYPSKLCREPVFNEHGMGYTCDVVLQHPGPCASLSSAPSVQRRDAWEAANPDWRKDVGNMDIDI